MSGLSEEEKKVASNLYNDINTAYWLSLGGLFICYMPVFGLICPIIALIKTMKFRKYSIKKGTANAAFIVSIIGLVISGLITISVLSFGGNNSTTQQTEGQQEKESDALTHNADDLTASGVRYGDLDNYSDIQKILLRFGDSVTRDEMKDIVGEYSGYSIYMATSTPGLEGYYIAKTGMATEQSGGVTCLSECINVGFYTFDGANGEQDIYYGSGLSSFGSADSAKPFFSCSKGYSPMVTIDHTDTKYDTWAEALAAYNAGL